MPWQFVHHCLQKGLQAMKEAEYAVVKADRRVGGVLIEVTLLQCSTCRERFAIMGHELFDQMQAQGKGGFTAPNLQG